MTLFSSLSFAQGVPKDARSLEVPQAVKADVPLVAKAKKTPKVTQIGDWGRVCEKVAGTEKEVCFIFQQLKQTGSDVVIMNTSIAINPKDDKPVISVTLPLGLLLPAGVQMKVGEEGKILRLPFLFCLQQGCRASVILDEDVLKQMLEGEQLLTAFVTAQRKPNTVPASLKGFAEAFESLKK